MSMRPIWLDYQQAPPGRQWPGFVIFIAGMVTTIVLLFQNHAINEHLEASERKVSLLQRQAERQRLLVAAADRKSENADPSKSSRPTHATARWEALFSTLETAGDESVTLLGLAPGTEEVSLNGEAKDLGAALDYMKRLQSGTVLAHAHLTEQEILKDHPRKPLRFTLVANWQEPPR